jgi:hypothetical protein
LKTPFLSSVGSHDTPIECDTSASRRNQKEKTMKVRQTMLSTALIAALLVTGAQAQVRTEPAGSPFTYEALGATPSLQLNLTKRTEARTAAPATGAAPAAAVRSGQSTYDAVGATPQTRQPEAVTVPSVAARAPTAQKGVR